MEENFFEKRKKKKIVNKINKKRSIKLEDEFIKQYDYKILQKLLDVNF